MKLLVALAYAPSFARWIDRIALLFSRCSAKRSLKKVVSDWRTVRV